MGSMPKGFRIDHSNSPRYLRQLEKEPYFQCGSKVKVMQAWYRRRAFLVLALGELAEDGLKTLALCGLQKPEIIEIPKDARFNAHGLEGACAIRKPLFNCLMNLRDLVPQYRGYITAPSDPLGDKEQEAEQEFSQSSLWEIVCPK